MSGKSIYGKIVKFICPECGYEQMGGDMNDIYCDKCFEKFCNLGGTGKIVKMGFIGNE